LFTGKVDVPVVILCLEGGPNTIKTMAEAIKNNTPAVVIGGSGRAADVVSYAYNLFDKYVSMPFFIISILYYTKNTNQS